MFISVSHSNAPQKASTMEEAQNNQAEKKTQPVSVARASSSATTELAPWAQGWRKAEIQHVTPITQGPYS